MDRPSLKDPAPERPPIWVDGRQQPKFHVRAWAAVGTQMARRSLAPWLGRTGSGLGNFGAAVAAGRYRVKTGWMGRASCIVPSHRQVAAGLSGLAARFSEAQRILLPEPVAPEPLAYPDLIRRPERSRAPVAPAPSPAPAAPALSLAADNPAVPRSDLGEPALAAIRALIHAVPDLPPEDQPAAPSAPVARPVEELIAAERPALGRRLLAGAARVTAPVLAHGIAWGLLLLVLPVGLGQAGLYHLNGGDLREWE